MTLLPPERIPEPVVRRLSLYLRQLEALSAAGVATLSSKRLGDALGVTDAQVRKDFAVFGTLGHPGVGYHTTDLITRLRHALGTDHEWNVVLVGAGNLGRALARYHGFAAKGFRLVGVFDVAPEDAAAAVPGLVVTGMETLETVVTTHAVRLAIVAVPGAAAQDVIDRLAACGVAGVLNFAPVIVTPPISVKVISVDLALQLEQLAFQVGSLRVEGN